MTLTDTDRHRLIAAAALTLVALPALWWANTSQNSSAPNLAVAGVDVAVDVAVAGDVAGDGAGDGADGRADGGADVSAEASAPAGASTAAVDVATDFDEAPPVFLDGPASAAGAGQSEIAVPAKPLIDGITAKATFRSTVTSGTCIAPGMTSGTRVTVVNLDNNRSMTCTTLLSPGTTPGQFVLHTAEFATIADLTDAPISVEIRR